MLIHFNVTLQGQLTPNVARAHGRNRLIPIAWMRSTPS